MIDKIVLIISLFVGFNNQSPNKKGSDCNILHKGKLPIATLKNELLGEWNYHYSYKNDTCFQIPQLGDLPRAFEFKTMHEDSLQITYPKLYQFAKKKPLFGLISLHEEKPFGNNSYPLINTISRDSSWARITHYVGGNGVGKSYSYILESVSNDTLVLLNERNYNVGSKKMNGVNHVYLKTNK